MQASFNLFQFKHGGGDVHLQIHRLERCEGQIVLQGVCHVHERLHLEPCRARVGRRALARNSVRRIDVVLQVSNVKSDVSVRGATSGIGHFRACT